MKTFIHVALFAVSALLIMNVVALSWPVITHPIVFTVWFGFLLVVVYKFFVRDAR